VTPWSTPRPTGPGSRGGRILALTFLVASVVAGCGIAASTDSSAPQPTLALPSYSLAVAETRRQIAAALAVDGLQLQDATQPFQPPEPPTVASAPRGVFQVVLPNDPNHGYIVVYEFRDTATAALAGRALAVFVGTGAGQVEFPPDTQHVIRQLGTTIIAYSWSPANSTDARAPKIITDLSTVGIAIPVPR